MQKDCMSLCKFCQHYKKGKSSSQENKLVVECFKISNLQVRGFKKHMISYLLSEGMF